MTKRKIIYLDQTQLKHPKLAPVLYNFPQHDWVAFQKCHRYHPVDSIYCRSGKNILPLRPTAKETLGWSMPAYDANFAKTWTEVTDQRCVDLWKTHSHRPWLICWSGGIDSTVVLVSILKNLRREERQNIQVACNFSSIIENPHFYYKYIEPNFTVIDSTEFRLDQNTLTQYFVMDGEPGDQLFAGMAGQKLMFSDPQCLGLDFRKSPDRLLQFFKDSVDDHFAQWFYTHLLENINSVDVPITTYHDLFWWIFFNLNWMTVKIRTLDFDVSSDQHILNLFLNNFVFWFDTIDYQMWAMRNNLQGVKYGNHLGQYKLVAKKYIYDFDRNDHYFNYKIKTLSINRVTYQKQWFCILDDYTRLNLNDHLDEIIELLPDHIEN